MRIFLAGASGLIGAAMVPLLVAEGHAVVGTTRSEVKAAQLRDLGADAVVLDVYDAPALDAAVAEAAPDLVIHQLTDLPSDPAEFVTRLTDTNARMRREGTANLLAAARAAGVGRVLAQSVAWELTGEGRAAKDYLESEVLAIGGVVVRYGQFYGPGTYHPTEVPGDPKVHLDTAARRTVELLDESSGIVTIVD